jgi:hypothetical protein
MAQARHRFLKYVSLPLGLALWLLLLAPLPWAARGAAFLLGAPFVCLGVVVVSGFILPRNGSRSNPALEMETWDVVSGRLHHSNTDLTWFQGRFLLVHATSPYHFGTPSCKLVVRASADARRWEVLAEIDRPGEDIRDPKFAVIGDRLFLYVLLNVKEDPQPYTTMVTVSQDGATWTPLTGIGHDGWLFWRPRTPDGLTWYCPAYWHHFNRTALFRSSDGLHWEQVSTIAEGGVVNETCLAFLEDGVAITAGRMEYSKEMLHLITGHARCSTLLSRAAPPYDRFEVLAETRLTRLDGPVLFAHRGRVYAVGRSQPHHGRLLTRPGAVLARKRTSLYVVADGGLRFISDLPSGGDTSYAGVLLRDGYLYISYYTSDIRRDFMWLIGMMEPTAVRMARIPLARLEAASSRSFPDAPLRDRFAQDENR